MEEKYLGRGRRKGRGAGGERLRGEGGKDEARKTKEGPQVSTPSVDEVVEEIQVVATGMCWLLPAVVLQVCGCGGVVALTVWVVYCGVLLFSAVVVPVMRMGNCWTDGRTD